MSTTLDKIIYDEELKTVTVTLTASRSSKISSLCQTAEDHFMVWQNRNMHNLGYKSSKNIKNIRGDIIDSEHFYYSEVYLLVFPKKKKINW